MFYTSRESTSEMNKLEIIEGIILHVSNSWMAPAAKFDLLRFLTVPTGALQALAPRPVVGSHPEIR